MLNFENALPTPEEERANAWRRMSLVAQIVFFVLTIVAIAAAYGFLTLLHLPPGWILAIVCIVLAEFLIQRHRFWRTGVESALWIGGLYAFIFSLPSSGKPEALLVLAAAAAIAGWRVRNALFGALALVLVTAYFAERQQPWIALFFAITIAIVALFALPRSWQRPSTELLWQILFLVMPVAGSIASWRSGGAVAIFIALAVGFAAIGIHFRLRVPLVGSAIAIAIAIIDARLPLSLELQMIIGGAIALAVAAAITRTLRERKSGFVLDLAEQSELEAVLSVAPALLPVHPAAEGGGATVKPQGGEFGGAGSSGNY